MKCPTCKGPIAENKDQLMFFCTKRANGCGFTISKAKFEEIVDKLYRKKAISPSSEDNSEAWNNFGLSPLAQGFDDSPALNN